LFPKAQLNLLSLHLTLVRQLPIIEHKIDRNYGGLSWKRQRPFEKSHNDDADDERDKQAAAVVCHL